MCASLLMHLFLSQRQSHLHNPLHIQVVSAGTLGLYERDSGPVTLSGSDQEKTHASLATVNDHRFYAMRYFGDYGFARPLDFQCHSQPLHQMVSRRCACHNSFQPGPGVTSFTQAIKVGDRAWRWHASPTMANPPKTIPGSCGARSDSAQSLARPPNASEISCSRFSIPP